MKKHNGVLVPLLSPFTKEMRTDVYKLEKLLQLVTSHQCHPFVLGTTGEAASIPEPEREKIVRTAVKYKGKNIRTYACVSDNCLENTINRVKKYADMGIDAVAAPLPSYYPLSAADMTGWYETLADQSPCPLLLYNIPATTGMSIPLEVADLLSRHPNIEGIKDSERDENRLSDSLKLWRDRTGFSHLMGWAAKSYEALEQGSDGLVPSSANLLPGIYARMYRAAAEGDHAGAMEMQKFSGELGEIYQSGRLLGESLAALKVLGASQGLCEPFVLPPLRQLPEAEAEKLRSRFQVFEAQLKNAGLTN